MKKLLSISVAFSLVFSVFSTPFSSYASAKDASDLDLDHYTETLELSEDYFSDLNLAVEQTDEMDEEFSAILEHAVVDYNGDEQTVTTKDINGDKIEVHYNNETDELVITSDAYTTEELKEAEETARELKSLFGDFEEVAEEEQVFSIMAAADQWTYSTTTKGNTKILKGSISLTSVALAGYLGLASLPGALTAVAIWVWENHMPTLWYSHKDYYKRKPNFSTKQVWQFYKDSKRTKKIGGTWTKIRTFYD